MDDDKSLNRPKMPLSMKTVTENLVIPIVNNNFDKCPTRREGNIDLSVISGCSDYRLVSPPKTIFNEHSKPSSRASDGKSLLRSRSLIQVEDIEDKEIIVGAAVTLPLNTQGSPTRKMPPTRHSFSVNT